MHVRTVFSVTALSAGLILACRPPAYAASGEERREPAVGTDIVEYRCTTTGVAGTQDIKVRVELTMPADATTKQQMTIGWHGSYAEGTALRAAAGGLSGAKLYAYASISGMSGLTSATGVGTLGVVGAGEVIPLPAEVPLKTTASIASIAGTATVRPAAMNIGDRPTEPVIECEVQNRDALKTYPLTVVAAGGGTTPTPGTSSPRPTHTVTATVTQSAATQSAATQGTETGKGGDEAARIPVGAAETGGGGEAGPDGRVLVSAGLLLTLTALAGLLTRRRAVRRR
ncbi:hypothetical protein [Microbispora sp. NPDC049125]|uniref:hypothetical protein n=1 Tax=Microbispora sp. NPDC049125 TaxID=3154929 RepID=UPI003464FC14